MANLKVNGTALKTKVKVARSPLFLDEKYTGTEPVWDTEQALTFTEEEFDHHLRRSFYYYNYYFSQNDLKKDVVAWLTETEALPKEKIDLYLRTKDSETPITVCSLMRAHRQGMPLKPKHKQYVLNQIEKILAAGNMKPVKEKLQVDTTPKPTIQDRLAEKTSEVIGELEGLYDEVMANKVQSIKPYDFLTVNKVPQSQLTKYESLFDARKLELEAAQGKQDEQLVEAYKHYKTADYKRIFAFIADFLQAIEQYRGVKKATKKARIKKAPSKEKLVAKLKYKKDDKGLKLVSINPVEIVGATALWVYNVKTRKLGCYVADSIAGSLAIKGTGIIGYDTIKSSSKTLRKPEEKLVEFMRASKVQLRKFLQDIKATETQLNGRINQDIILLKVT